MMVNGEKGFRALARDKSRRSVERDVHFTWRMLQGEGNLRESTGELVTFVAGPEPGLVVLEVVARQGAVECQAESAITVADELIEKSATGGGSQKGLP